ncbi:flagellar hook-length control protein FliK [Roseobacter sp.]|uniref:flagellar hook-length control protein FliK n=1 Tax=Roseobacter sp. TaxID=1907202 RepID=UPI0032996C86
MTQVAPKNRQHEKMPAADKATDDAAEADFEAAYTADDDPKAEETTLATADDSNVEVEEPKPTDITAIDGDAAEIDDEFALGIEADFEEVVKPKQDTVSEGPAQKPTVPATSELLFAQRVRAQQDAVQAKVPDAVPARADTPTVAQSLEVPHPQRHVQSPLVQGKGDVVQPAQDTALTAQLSNAAQGEANSRTIAALNKEPVLPAPAVLSTTPEEPTVPTPEMRVKGTESRKADRFDMLTAGPSATPKVNAETAVPRTPIATPQPVMPITAQPDSAGLDVATLSPVGDVEGPSTWDPRSTAPTTLAQTLSRPETPSMIGRQMAEVLQRLPDRPVELSLNPEELGRVRMSISASEGGITLNVLAERPETLDLMRRHIDQLAREFQALGYENINFAFNEGQTDAEGQANGDGSSELHASASAEAPDVEPVVPVTMAPSSGVDLRI